MEMKTKAIATHYDVDVDDVKNKFLSDKLKGMNLDGTGNKTALTDRLIEALDIVIDSNIEPVQPEKPIKKNSKAGLYQKYQAVMSTNPQGEAPVMDWNNKLTLKKIRLPHSVARMLNAQKVNSGIEYVLID
jgi:hypothetical protein